MHMPSRSLGVARLGLSLGVLVLGGSVLSCWQRARPGHRLMTQPTFHHDAACRD
jgi:hypothetical protein